MLSPSLAKLRMCSWHVVVAFSGPWARPLIIMSQLPQMPSRQSWSNATGSWPSRISASFSRSIISRNDISGLMPSRWYVTIAPAAVRDG